MAGTMTHAYFARDVYDKLDNNIKEKLNYSNENMKAYGQGHDIFYFYYSLNFKKASKIRKEAKRFHRKNTKDFFINIVEYIKSNNLENDSDSLSFLYGYICHYVMDFIIHPYVIYKGGIFEKKKKETYKYNSLHSVIETYIDAYMISINENIEPGKFKNYKFCFNYTKNANLINLINYTFENTYNVKNASKYFFRSIKTMKFLYHLMRYDPLKIKYRIYALFDKITSKKIKKATPITYAVKLNNDEYYLNLNHNVWSHPRYDTEKHTESFFDLYNNATNEALRIINGINEVLFNNKNIEFLDDYFLNLSFITGKDCSDKARNQYFEF